MNRLAFSVSLMALAACSGTSVLQPSAAQAPAPQPQTSAAITLSPQQVRKQTSNTEWLSSRTTLPPHSLRSVTLRCPKSYSKVISGGADMPLPGSHSSQIFISSVQSFPTKKYNGWVAYVLNDYGEEMNLTVYALCSRT
jgi:hypothetical protein